MGAELAVVLAVTVLAAAVNRVAGAFFQSRRKFGISLFIILIHNWIVLCAVPVVLIFDKPEALPAALTVTCGYVAMAALGWWKGFAARHPAEAPGGASVASRAALPAQALPADTMLREGLAVVGVQLAVAALFQLDRLLIPRALSIRDLATYSVVSSLAASPFRMLQTGFSFALLPRLRACESRAAIRRLLRHEAAIALGIATLAAACVLLFTPWVLGHVLQSRYAFAASLLHALIIVGFVRVWSGIAGATVAALGSARQLVMLNVCGWIALAVAAVCAFAARGGGLAGVVYGIGAGWLVLASAASVIGARAVAGRAASGTPR
jgi:O-antigen/teichoic acid export membrane protein